MVEFEQEGHWVGIAPAGNVALTEAGDAPRTLGSPGSDGRRDRNQQWTKICVRNTPVSLDSPGWQHGDTAGIAVQSRSVICSRDKTAIRAMHNIGARKTSRRDWTGSRGLEEAVT
jgi:hypothetical protein